MTLDVMSVETGEHDMKVWLSRFWLDYASTKDTLPRIYTDAARTDLLNQSVWNSEIRG
jgi:hypothetical protein